jgi:hypothetical protein
MQMPRATKDVIAGLVFVGLGLFFAVSVLVVPYRIGTPLQMGPGYFPLLLGGLLALLGIAILVGGLRGAEPGEIGAIPWKAIALLTAAVVFFGLTVRGLGLVPSLFGAILLATLAGPRLRLLETVAITIGLTVLSLLIFVGALGLHLRLLGPWIPL